MTTWYEHFPLSHPWMPSRKRKNSTSPDLDPTSSSDVDSQESQSLPMKRRRYDLARNLSQLSLFEQACETARSQFQPPTLPHNPTLISAATGSHALDSSTHPPELPADAPMDADGDAEVIDNMHPIIEEPAGAPVSISDIRMHNTSSYEPEKDRIVITDLDGSEDEADTPPHTPAGSDAQYSVSPAFLSHINASKFLLPLLKPPTPSMNPDSSQALVIFKPSPWIAKDSHELEEMYRARDKEEDNRELIVTEVSDVDSDAMEIG